jgi:hypothetical protein
MSENMLGVGALAEVAGPLKDFSDKLNGADGPLWLSAFKRFLRKEDPWANSFAVTVDYDRSIEEMVASGKYDSTNTDITAKNFPVDGKGTSAVNIELVHFNRTMESDEVRQKLAKQGLRLATLPELLAFAATYPEKQRELTVVALGSVWRSWNDRRYVAILYSNADGRSLSLHWYEDRWSGSYRFAAVRK